MVNSNYPVSPTELVAKARKRTREATQTIKPNEHPFAVLRTKLH